MPVFVKSVLRFIFNFALISSDGEALAFEFFNQALGRRAHRKLCRKTAIEGSIFSAHR